MPASPPLLHLLTAAIASPTLQEQAARLFALAYAMSSHILVDSESCDLSLDFSFAIAIADNIQVSVALVLPSRTASGPTYRTILPFQISDSEKLTTDRQCPPELFWCLSPEAVSLRTASCPDEIPPNNPNFMENYLRISGNHSKAICSLFNHRYQVCPQTMHAILTILFTNV